MKIDFVSKSCFDKIKEFEGYKSRAYLCPSGVLTIGYGHTSGVKHGDVVSIDEAEKMLVNDLRPICRYLSSLNIYLSQGMFDALADFIFNVGLSAFKRSTLFKKVLQNSEQSCIANEFRKWVYSRGKILSGLKSRREWEIKQYYSCSLLR